MGGLGVVGIGICRCYWILCFEVGIVNRFFDMAFVIRPDIDVHYLQALIINLACSVEQSHLVSWFWLLCRGCDAVGTLRRVPFEKLASFVG
jgi:hypothetical protein